MADPAAFGSQNSAPLPNYNKNPLRSLRIDPVGFTVGGREYEIPALSAADWLEFFMADSWIPDDLFMDLMPDGVHMLMDSEVPMNEIFDLVLEVIEEVGARRWWITMGIVGLMKANWSVLGAKLMTQTDATKVSLAAWLDMASVVIYEAIPASERAMILSKLENPPPGYELPMEDFEIPAEQFMSMMND